MKIVFLVLILAGQMALGLENREAANSPSSPLLVPKRGQTVVVDTKGEVESLDLRRALAERASAPEDLDRQLDELDSF